MCVCVCIVVQLPSHVRLFATPWTVAHQASLSLTISRTLPTFMFIASEMLSSRLILWRPFLLLPSVFPSIRDFSNESSVCIRWPKYWSFNFSISPSSDYSGLISLQTDWFDLLAVQGTLRSLPAPQFKGINSLAFCLLYSPALTTVRDHWKDHSLDSTDLCQQSTVSAFQHAVQLCHRFPAKKQLSSDFVAAVTLCGDFGAQKRNSVTTSTISPFICHAGMGPDAMIFIFLIFNVKPALSLSSFTLIKRLLFTFCH